MSLRYFMNRVHLWIGLAVALPLILISLSGSVLVYRWSLDYQLNRDWYTERPVEDSIQWETVHSKLTESADGRLERIRYSPTGRGTILGETTDDEFIHLDPRTNTVLGKRTLWDWRSLIWWIQELHINLFMGRAGFLLVSLVTVISLIGLVSGFVLWLLPLGKSWLSRFGIHFSGTPYKINWDTHNALGFYSLPVVLAIVLTGSVIGFWFLVSPILYGLVGEKPTRLRAPSVTVQKGEFSLDRVVRAINRRWTDHSLSRIALSEKPSRPVRVRVQEPDVSTAPGLHFVWINPYDGAIVKTIEPENRSVIDGLFLWMFPLHYGSWGDAAGSVVSAVVRLAWLLGGLIPALLAATGVLIWWWTPS